MRGAAEGASGQSQLPAQRPTWMVVLASLMMVFAFNLFLDGLNGLSGGSREAGARVEDAPARGTPEAAEQALQRALQTVDPTLLRLHAASKLVFAAVLVFAVAAIATRDRRGRRGTLLAAWVGIGHHLLGAVFFIAVVRTGLMTTGGEWMAQVAEALGSGPGGKTLTPEQLRAWADALLVVIPVAVALLGVGFSALLILFFGGVRGRSYYGVPGASGGEARPGV